jgi:hypothetical protein
MQHLSYMSHRQYTLEATQEAAVHLSQCPVRLQHGEGPGDPSTLARDLQQKLAELQVCAAQQAKQQL